MAERATTSRKSSNSSGILTRNQKEQNDSNNSCLLADDSSPASNLTTKRSKRKKSINNQKDSSKSIVNIDTSSAASSRSTSPTKSKLNNHNNNNNNNKSKIKKSKKNSKLKEKKKLKSNLNKSNILTSKRSAKSKAIQAISNLNSSKIDKKIEKPEERLQVEEEEEEEEALEEEDEELDEESEQDIDFDQEEEEEEELETESESDTSESESEAKKPKRSVSSRSRRSSRASSNSKDKVEAEENESSRLRRPSSSSNKSSSLIPVKKPRLSSTCKSNPATNDSSSSCSSTSFKKKETGSCITKSSLNSNTSTSRRSQAQQLTSQEQDNLFTEASNSNSLFSKFKHKSFKMNTNTNTNTNTNSTSASNSNQDQTSNTKQSSSTNSTGGQQQQLATSAPSSSGFGLIESAESSDNDNTADFSRLTDLLQSRGLPSHIVNAFGSKVQQFIHRTMSSGISGRFQQLISSLQQPDESLKLTALTELCQLLVMGNEDTLVGFPIKQAVPLLLQCMSSESENYDLMNHACRTLTYMMESLPRSTSVIAEGISTFLEKLQIIQCMDVAEQSLTALEILSRRHSKQILNATQSGSVSACLTYIDFFSMTAQRNALQITANCCQNMIKDEFVNIKPSLAILSQRLTHSDKKSVESVCTVFARLVENFQHDHTILKEISAHNVLHNMQQLLVIQPPVVSSSHFVTILHTIYLMCSNCNELSVDLIDNDICSSLKFLLIGNSKNAQIEILSTRSPQELYEIVSIIGEILPKLPNTNVFSIDDVLKKSSITHQNEHIVWQWKDENEILRPYTPIDSRIIESAYIQEEDECILNTMGRTYVIDFNSMLQINEETGTARPVTRKVLTNNLNNTENNSNIEDQKLRDSRLDYLNKKPNLYSEFILSLFPIVYEVYNSSAGPAIKHRSLRTLLRMIYFASSLKHDDKKINCLLYNLLSDLPISSHIASMLASQDNKIIVSALQMSEILLNNLPDVFSVYFHREGVIYQIDKLIEAITPSDNSVCEPRITRSTSSQLGESNKRKIKSSATSTCSKTSLNSTTPSRSSILTAPSAPTSTQQSNSPNQTKSKYLRNILTKINPSTSTGSTAACAISNPMQSRFYSTQKQDTNILPRYGSSKTPVQRRSLQKQDNPTQQQQQQQQQQKKSIDFNLINKNKELVKKWILEQAKRFKEAYLILINSKKCTKELDKSSVLERLIKASKDLNCLNDVKNLQTLAIISEILKKTDISSFEMIHSNLIDKFIKFLSIDATQSTKFQLEQSKLAKKYSNDLQTVLSNDLNLIRCKQFLKIFSQLPLVFNHGEFNQNLEQNNQKSLFSMLVSKLHNCVNQLEQYTVRVHDVPNSIGSGKNAIKFFATHQLKCMLARHSSISSTPPNSTSQNSLRQWKGGHVKVDPLALVSTIEKYLLMRGIHKPVLSIGTTTTTTGSLATPGTFLSSSLPTSTSLLASKTGTKTETKPKPRLRPLTETTSASASSSTTSTSNKSKKTNKKANKSKQKEEFEQEQEDIEEEEEEEDDEEDVDIGNEDYEEQIIDQTLEEEDDEEEENLDNQEFEEDDEEEHANRIIEDNNEEDLEQEDEDLIDEDEEDEDDDDIESAMSAFLGSSSSSRFSSMSAGARAFLTPFGTNYPKLELLINDHVLPSNMTIYQAIKQYSSSKGNNPDLENENDMETSLLNNAIWSKVHLIHYRLASSSTPASSEEQTDSKRTLRNSKEKQSKSSKKSQTPEPEVKQFSNLQSDIIKTLLYTNLNIENLKLYDSIQLDKSIESISLLNLLNNMNRNWFMMYQDTHSLDSFETKNELLISQSEFINPKLTAKANRQLLDPLIIMTGHLPKWLPELIQSCQFLFPFETRIMYFYITHLDRDRAMQKLIDLNSDILANSQNERFKPKLDRKKRTISRSNDLIKQADLILNEFCLNTLVTASTSSAQTSSQSKPALLEIQYENEVGTGLGPTLEFYALVSLELQKCENEMWRGEKIKLNNATGSNKDELFYFSKTGLYPSPVLPLNHKHSNKTLINKLKSKFKFMGKFMAKSIQDFRVLDIQLSKTFYKWLLDYNLINEQDLKHVDSDLYKSCDLLKEYLRKRRLTQIDYLKNKITYQIYDNELKQLEKEVSDLDLDFTLPGFVHIELKKGGKDLNVSLENLEEYLKLIVEWSLIRGVQAQMESFREGFESILPITCLKQFYPEELERLFCGSGYNKWDSKMLIGCTRCDHGYTHDSKPVQFLFEIMSEFSSDEQRLFLQFVTGSPRLPIGGLKSLIPQLTIVKKTMDTSNANPDNYLPSVMTCVNYLKVPEYSSVNIMKEKLLKAMKDGQLSFHLS